MSLENELKQLAEQWTPLSPPSGHEKRFAKRLKGKQKFKRPYWSAAAVLLLLFGLGISQWPGQNSTNAELEVSTTFYTQAIQTRLMHLEKNTPAVHAQSLEDAKTQLVILQEDYQRLQQQWQEGSPHPILLKALIQNLQQQLNLLQTLEKNLTTIEKNDYENVF